MVQRVKTVILDSGISKTPDVTNADQSHFDLENVRKKSNKLYIWVIYVDGCQQTMDS